MKKGLIIAAILWSFGWGTVVAQTYVVDTQKSELMWQGEKVTGKHWGVVNIKSGKLDVNGSKITGTFDIDMTSIVNHDLESEEWNTKLVNHLKSDDFFSVDQHPVANLKVTKVALYSAKEGENYTHRVTGDLTIKGITHEITFPATINISDTGMTAQADIVIDRTKWDVRFRSGSFFENLGDKLIYDDIKFSLSLVADKIDGTGTN